MYILNPVWKGNPKYIRRKEDRVRRDEISEQKRWLGFEGTTLEIQQPLRKRSLKLLGNGRQQDYHCSEGMFY